MPKIDLNCDLGESFGVYTLGMDEEILPFITSANIACGFHASDPVTMRKTVKLAKEAGAALGAHGRVVALAVGAECLLAGLAVGKLLFVKLFQLVFLSIAEGEPFEYAGGAVAFLEVFGALGVFNTSLLLPAVVVLFVLGYGGEGDERHCNCSKSENFLFHKSNVFLKLLFVILFAFFDKNNSLAFNLTYRFNSDLTLVLSVS